MWQYILIWSLESDGEIDAAHKISFGFERPVHQDRIKPTRHPLSISGNMGPVNPMIHFNFPLGGIFLKFGIYLKIEVFKREAGKNIIAQTKY